ncbi:MAG: sigma-54-dependent Fis family transcriptional regulator [Deltaproteobacteria bacterium]|nr:sigma-54-dependent Fis family transcriptional regulator [Deltaproteobacteria bacterium]
MVDSDPVARQVITHHVEALGHRAVLHDSAESLLQQPGDELLLACVALGDQGAGGFELLSNLRQRHPRLPIVVVSAQQSVEWVVEAMRSGAADCIAKPFDASRFSAMLLRQLAQRPARAIESNFIGDGPAMRELRRHIDRVADSDVVVYLRGETGSGKELVTREIHQRGPRRRGPFVAVNCAAIPHQLQESEFFGHERGAFTGAVSAHRGKFEQANNGTLFLDELGEMSPSTQAVLLRVLEERKVQRVGSTTVVPINVRVICATNRDLEAEVAAGRFRQDLYFRLAVYRIDLPPLRNRTEDIAALCQRFLEQSAPGGAVVRMSQSALEILKAWSWPGNVRELQNVVHRASLIASGPEILPMDLPPSMVNAVSVGMGVGKGDPLLDDNEPLLPFREIERRAILRAMRAVGGSVDKAAKALGLSRATVYRRLVEFASERGSEV